MKYIKSYLESNDTSGEEVNVPYGARGFHNTSSKVKNWDSDHEDMILYIKDICQSLTEDEDIPVTIGAVISNDIEARVTFHQVSNFETISPYIDNVIQYMGMEGWKFKDATINGQIHDNLEGMEFTHDYNPYNSTLSKTNNKVSLYFMEDEK